MPSKGTGGLDWTRDHQHARRNWRREGDEKARARETAGRK
jgi:hypothetical protein